MGRLTDRVALVTGAGRGLGRAHALALAGEGAAVVVNDFGSDIRGTAHEATPAQQVVNEIRAAGGSAAVSGHDVSSWDDAAEMIDFAIARFGALDVLVNNAGIFRSATLAKLTEADWQAAIGVHLTGHVAPTAHAMAYWRERSRADLPVSASVVHTSSVAGFTGNYGEAAFAAAKLGVLALSRVVSLEGSDFGVRSNVIAPSARTRLTHTALGPPPEQSHPDPLTAASVSPLVVWLAGADCPADGQIFHIRGDQLYVIGMPAPVRHLVEPGGWTLEALDTVLPSQLLEPVAPGEFGL
jgi:NAD(P)-dependent dehydrogenase (short-subunit alcohol dehydrogenase family)